MTNVLITGERGVGKSTLLCTLLQQFNIKPTGFQSLPYYIQDERKGFYLHGLVELQPYQNNQPICVQDGESTCIPITESFEKFGTQILEASLSSGENIILMDEIGLLEKDAHDFWRQIEKCLESPKLVVGVLKKAQHTSLERIKNRDDTFILELTNSNRNTVYDSCYTIIKHYLEGQHE